MCCGVALHVNNAKLDVGMREKALGDRQQSAEVIMNDDHDATKATFNESFLNELPIFKIFTASSCRRGFAFCRHSPSQRQCRCKRCAVCRLHGAQYIYRREIEPTYRDEL